MADLSIIIPVYNVEDYLEECLNSIRAQTFEDFEVICVNDGSTDSSLDILRKFEAIDKRFKVITQGNKGQSCARNAGLAVAAGKYITFVDSDDVLENKTYETALKYIEDVDIVCFGIQVFGDANMEMRSSDNEYYKVRHSGKLELNSQIRHRTDCSPCNKIFKKAVLDKYGIIFPENLHYEDAAFYWKYILSVNSAYYLDKYFYHYRRRPKSIMNKSFSGKNTFAIDHLYIVADIYKFLNEHGFLEQNRKLFEQLFFEFFILAHKFSSFPQKGKVLEVAQLYAKDFFKGKKPQKVCIKNILKGKFNDIFEPDLAWYKKIFTIKNVYIPGANMTKPFLYVFGIRFKLHNKNEEIIDKINAVYYVNNDIKDELEALKDEVLQLQTLKNND